MAARIKLRDVYVSYPVFTTGGSQSVLTAAAQVMSFGQIRRGADGVKHIDALRGIDLDLQPGTRLGLIGRNGSGKSTLLKVLAGVNWPTRGVRKSSGQISAVLSILAGLDADKTGRQNVVLMCQVFGLGKAEIDRMIDDVSEFTELGEFFDMPLRAYSAGMQVRLNFALATALQGEILLIDEVLAAGDQHFINRAAARLKTYAENAKITVIATHSHHDLMSFCDTAIRLERGRIVDFGAPDLVWDRYANSKDRPAEDGAIPVPITIPAAS
jgi:ABC-type polysaccharide/polyol phosphate transport system ATPase subunit